MVKLKLTGKMRMLAGVLCVLGFIITGCASMPERNPVPLELTEQAVIRGIRGARFWGDGPEYSMKKFHKFTDADFRKGFSGVYEVPHNYLAISGGGANGAFSAGLLNGWTASGTRPEFTMVTGISTGALAAPFAFLGADYDDMLKAVFTMTSTEDIVKKRNILSAVFGDSMTDTAPLRMLLKKYITPELIDKIAEEHQRGRRLFIGTMNLDAGRAVIWSIGAIASSDSPLKTTLIHDVMQASSAIPVAFPPVFVSVDVNGKVYDEMHVDGGTASQVFVYPTSMDWRKITEKLKVAGKPNVFVIRNAFLEPDYRGVKRNVIPIAMRSIDSMIRTQGIGDLYQIFALCKRDGNNFHLAYIPSDFEEVPTEEFDPIYMKKLYDLGYETALKGYPWKENPPNFIR
jgi:predicted patatin/cPLA2 family phospholipase